MPFEEGVGQDEAATSGDGVAKGRFFGNGFGAGVDALDTDLGILGPGRDQAPAEFGHFEVGRASPKDGGAVGGPDYGLGGGRDLDLFLADLGFFVFAGVAGAHGG